MNLNKVVSSKDLKNYTEQYVQRIKDYSNSFVDEVKFYLEQAMLFANLEIQNMKKNGLDVSDLSEFAQKLYYNPNMQISEGELLATLFADNEVSEKRIPTVMQKNKQPVLEDYVNLEVEQTEEQVKTKKSSKPKTKRTYKVLQTIDIGEGCNLRIEVVSKKQIEQQR